MKKAFLSLVRTDYLEDRTLGELYVDGTFFCYTLEDAARRDGIKIAGKTCIPEGVYPVTLTQSARFGRITPEVQEVPGFSGIRIHGGNRPEDTEGCILAAYNKLPGGIIQGTAEKSLTVLLSQRYGGGAWLLISYASGKTLNT